MVIAYRLLCRTFGCVYGMGFYGPFTLSASIKALDTGYCLVMSCRTGHIICVITVCLSLDLHTNIRRRCLSQTSTGSESVEPADVPKCEACCAFWHLLWCFILL
jgi:hypothetical protein